MEIFTPEKNAVTQSPTGINVKKSITRIMIRKAKPTGKKYIL